MPADATHRLAATNARTPFRRRFLVPSAVLLALEAVGIGLPAWWLFSLGRLPARVLWATVLPVGGAAWLLWSVAMMLWLWPVREVIGKRARSERVERAEAAHAYRVTVAAPVRALVLRATLYVASAGALGIFFHEYGGWPWTRVGEFCAITGLHAYVVSCVRAVWWERILIGVRHSLFVVGSPLRRFEASHFRHLLLVAMVVIGGVGGAQAAFTYFFIPITRTQFLQFQTFVPLALAITLATWAGAAWLMTQDLRVYLSAAQREVPTPPTPAATIFRRAQNLPYRLAVLHWLVGAVLAIAGAVVARARLNFDFDDAIIVALLLFVLSFAAAIYGALWHREVVRPLLVHLTTRYRVPVRNIGTRLSLRFKLLMSFGGIVVLACGMALIWGFVQYKNQATEAASRQAELGLSWVRSELHAELLAHPSPPTATSAQTALRQIAAHAPEASAVIYYIDGAGQVEAFGGGPMGAPTLPWYTRQRIEQARFHAISLAAAELTGRATRLEIMWRNTLYDVGAVAVMYPSYRGRGQSMVRPLKELLVFFLVLFAACAGIVTVTVAQFVAPIRRLEQRADAMARGELADPVTGGGEGDEVGRLTAVLEDMRRALRDKLRSTEEVNVDLERAVQMRTADLAKKNRELADALQKLTQAQAQLVRSEKLASIGQLVAGIAHEINNPVNAIVNTVGPLQETIADIESPDATVRAAAVTDIRDMVRVVQSGAQRTKAIVTALHNYSRTDDESVVEFDIDRSLSDSLELLRHLLRNNIQVHKQYGGVGKLRGHAGQIGQVFMNLLTNAAQAVAGRPDAAITITTSASAETIQIEIQDNGAGIPAEVLPRIWDPFFTTKDVGEGTGLGLSIVHELVERHGGTINVETIVGEGTRFVIRLPRQLPQAKVLGTGQS